MLQYPVVVEEEISNLVSPVLCCLGHSATYYDLYARAAVLTYTRLNNILLLEINDFLFLHIS